MKYQPMLISILFTAIAGWSSAPQKLALLVAVGKYDRGLGPDKDWWNLTSAKDIDMMKRCLEDRFGFSEGGILVLKDEQATRQGILDAFQRQLIDKAKPGDTVVFDYSGHGQRVADDNGDEIDGMDETLVPYDYLTCGAQDGAKTNIRDDTVGELLDKLSKKMEGKGNITVILDSCFSGTATRGEPPAGRLVERGRDWNEKLDGPRPKPKTSGEDHLLDSKPHVAGGYVLLTACRSDQTAKEVNGMGAMTYYLTQALQKATPKTTYRSLFERLRIDVVGDFRDQDPQFEGDADKLLFAGAAAPTEPYLVVQPTDNADEIRLPIGALHGATAGSHFAIYRADTDVKDPKNRIADATISTVRQDFSLASLAGKVAPEDLKAARAVETSHAIGTSSLAVFLGDPSLAGLVKGAEIATTADVTKESYDVRLTKVGANVRFERKSGGSWSVPAEENAVREALVGEWRWQYLSKLRNESKDKVIDFQVRIKPLDVKLDSHKEITSAKPRVIDASKPLALKVDEYFDLEVKNTCMIPIYVTILELGPAGDIAVVFPSEDQVRAQQAIPADGEWHRLEGRWVLTEPYGLELFKAIATPEPQDFHPVVFTAAKRGKEDPMKDFSENSQPLAQLLFDASSGTRGTKNVNPPPAYWATADIAFELKPNGGKVAMKQREITLAALTAFAVLGAQTPNLNPSQKPTVEKAKASVDIEKTILDLAEKGKSTKNPAYLLSATGLRMSNEQTLKLRHITPTYSKQVPDDGRYDSVTLLNMTAQVAAETGNRTYLELAAKMAENPQTGLGNKALAGIIRAMAVTARGSIVAPVLDSGALKVGENVTYTMDFEGAKRAEACVNGGKLFVEIRDANGLLIANGFAPCKISWFPKKMGAFQIKVKNVGKAASNFVLETN